MKIIRAFPRKTNATPDDENVRIGMPGMFDECDEVHISVTFDWDKKYAEEMEYQWKPYAGKTFLHGPAYNHPGGEFEPGMYLKKGYTITSRGCPNKCWFCQAWKNEGNEIRELPIKEGFIVLDNNLLACSKEHILSVFDMLSIQKEKARFTGGLEAKRFKDWHCALLKVAKPKTVFFAYDEPDDWEPLVEACKKLKRWEMLKKTEHIYCCYVLIGYPRDTIDKAEKRLNDVVNLGLFPQAMLYENDDITWKRFQREWANKIIVGKKMSENLQTGQEGSND